VVKSKDISEPVVQKPVSSKEKRLETSIKFKDTLLMSTYILLNRQAKLNK